jgi:hypothetical protein
MESKCITPMTATGKLYCAAVGRLTPLLQPLHYYVQLVVSMKISLTIQTIGI